MSDTEAVNKLYGNRIRVRVCGICVNAEDEILMVNHSGVGKGGSLWAPPGGGLNRGETLEEALVREFKEETGLDVEVKEFLFINEFLSPPLHAIEVFFKVEIKGGKMSLGTDPEMGTQRQIIKELKYWSCKEIERGEAELFHSIFKRAKTLEELFKLKGFFGQADF